MTLNYLDWLGLGGTRAVGLGDKNKPLKTHKNQSKKYSKEAERRRQQRNSQLEGKKKTKEHWRLLTEGEKISAGAETGTLH